MRENLSNERTNCIVSVVDCGRTVFKSSHGTVMLLRPARWCNPAGIAGHLNDTNAQDVLHVRLGLFTVEELAGSIRL